MVDFKPALKTLQENKVILDKKGAKNMSARILDSREAVRFLLAEFFARLSSVIAISGITCSGKTTFSGRLSLAFQKNSTSVATVPLDSYFRDRDDPCFPKDRQSRLVFDIPGAYLSDKFVSDVHALVLGNPIHLPSYDLKKNRKLATTGEGISPAQIIVAEGLFVGQFLQASSIPVFSVFIDTPIEACLARRIERDCRLYGVRAEQVIDRFRSMVLPYLDQYVLVQRQKADLIVSGERG